jgi:phosphoribosylaminoimidazole (AIR) synthetase
MFHVFNMGLGMLVVIPPGEIEAARGLLPELRQVGEIVAGERVVELV